jgi:hypothetical protein
MGLSSDNLLTVSSRESMTEFSLERKAVNENPSKMILQEP